MLRSEAAEIAGFGVRQQYPARRKLTVDPEPKLPLTVRRRSEAQNPFCVAMSDASEVGRGVWRGAQELARLSGRLEGVVDGEQHPVNPDGVGGCPERWN